jgi:hypothetical protein
MTVTSAVVLPNESKTPDQLRELFSTDEILWFDDGRWGKAGYAMANGQGKSWTDNSTVYKVHKLLGHMLFDLMHRQDVKFSDPPHKNWWWDWQLAIVACRRMLDNIAVDSGTDKNFDETHVTATPRTFLVFPVPFFGMRVRQEDILEQCELCLKLLGEIQQHSTNDRQYYITGAFARLVNGFLTEMHMKVAIKFFGYTRAEVMALGEAFKISEDRFTAEKYKPEWSIPSVERSTERPPRLWWPTENDLSAIKGVAYSDAIHFARRWPMTYLEGEGDWESTLPGLKNRVLAGDPMADAMQQAENASQTLEDERAPGQAP